MKLFTTIILVASLVLSCSSPKKVVKNSEFHQIETQNIEYSLDSLSEIYNLIIPKLNKENWMTITYLTSDSTVVSSYSLIYENDSLNYIISIIKLNECKSFIKFRKEFK